MRQPQRDIDRRIKLEGFDCRQPLVVVSRHHHVKLTPALPVEDRIPRQTRRQTGELRAQTIEGGIQHGALLTAKDALLTRMRIQTTHTDARRLRRGTPGKPRRTATPAPPP